MDTMTADVLEMHNRALETVEVKQRMELLLGLMDAGHIAQVENRYEVALRSRWNRPQRDYYLNEQMKAFRKKWAMTLFQRWTLCSPG